MDIRIMEYYLAIIREGNISAAAEALHVSQPALSRQIRDLEEELGVRLFNRGSRKIQLTEEGMILRRRAEEMVHLMQMTEREITMVRGRLSGEIHIGSGESVAFHYLSRPAEWIRRDNPDVRFTITSGDTSDLIEQLDNGLLDVALLFTDYDRSVYSGIRLPDIDRLGVLMRRDNPLAQKKEIAVNDLLGLPVIVPRAAADLLSSDPATAGLNVVTVYNLIYNASVFVEDGIGCAIGFDSLINVSGDSPLTFRPLAIDLHQQGHVIWKKYQSFTPAVTRYIEILREQFEQHDPQSE